VRGNLARILDEDLTAIGEGLRDAVRRTAEALAA